MTEEDRALRRQWVKDQHLSPSEPRYVKEVQPRNLFRRLYMGPTDYVFSKLIPVLGNVPTSMARVVIPRLFLIMACGYWAYYQLKYHHRDWTRSGGFHIFRNKPRILCPQDAIPQKHPNDFFDMGFKNRTALRDGVTSSYDRLWRSKTLKPENMFQCRCPRECNALTEWWNLAYRHCFVYSN